MAVELKHLRSARNSHHDLGNGQRENRVYTQDKHYYNHDLRGDGEGGWRKCDLTPVAGIDGWAVEFAPYKASIPRYADGALVVQNVRSDGVKHNKQAITSAAYALRVEGVLEGSQITYPNAFGAGSDLIHRILPSGVARLVRVRAGMTPQLEYRISFNTNGIDKIERGNPDKYELDARGPKVTDSGSKTDITVDGETSFIAPFSAFTTRAGSAQIASVTIEQTSNTAFDIVKTAPAWWDGKDDLYIDDTQTVYADYDGDVYKTALSWADARDAVSGTATTTAAAYMYSAAQKSGANYYVYRCFVSFPNTVPVGATITAASLTLTSYATTGSGDKAAPFQWTTPASITTGTYDDFAATQLATEQTWPATNATATWPLNASGLALIPATGTSYYCIRDYTHDVLNSAATDADSIAWKTMDTAGTASDPVLVITYTPAVVGAGNNFMMMGVG